MLPLTHPFMDGCSIRYKPSSYGVSQKNGNRHTLLLRKPRSPRAPSALGRLHNPCRPWMGLFESGSKMFQKHWIILCSTIQYIVDDHNPIGLWYIYLHLGDF